MRMVTERARGQVEVCSLSFLSYLVPHVPDDAVLGRGEDVVQGDGQLRDAERGAEVA